METTLRVTFVVDAAGSALACRAAAAAESLGRGAAADAAIRGGGHVAAAPLPGTVRARTIAAGALIGRDLRECDRIVAWGWHPLAAASHLRELVAQCRSKVVVMVPDAAAAACVAPALLWLRRHAAHVLVDDAAMVPILRRVLLAPVHAVRGGDDASALAAVLRLAPGPADAVDAHLVEARQWVARGDLAPAFAAASRALRLAPDQPGIIADVARILANLGDTARAEQLCVRFLRQRPDAAPVREALAQLRATVG